VKPGDKIKVQIHPMKNGKPGGQVVRAFLSDGHELTTPQVRR
jgi:hypothetical protein